MPGSSASPGVLRLHTGLRWPHSSFPWQCITRCSVSSTATCWQPDWLCLLVGRFSLRCGPKQRYEYSCWQHRLAITLCWYVFGSKNCLFSDKGVECSLINSQVLWTGGWHQLLVSLISMSVPVRMSRRCRKAVKAELACLEHPWSLQSWMREKSGPCWERQSGLGLHTPAVVPSTQCFPRE